MIPTKRPVAAIPTLTLGHVVAEWMTQVLGAELEIRVRLTGL
jgi:hypothetical protein